jgi:hypothetical protein
MTTGLLEAPPAVEERPALWWLPYVYLLRVQLITAFVVVVGPPLALFSTLFRGLFDLDYGSPWRTFLGMALVTLAALSTAWTLLATTWNTLSNGPARFGTVPVRTTRQPITPRRLAIFGVLALPTILVAALYTWTVSGASLLVLVAGAVAGAAGATALLLASRKTAHDLQRAVYRRRPRGLAKAIRWVVDQFDRENVREGFIDPTTNELAEPHLLAWVVFVLSTTLYLAIGVGKWLRIGYETNVSTLACVLLLILMVCWLLVGMTFFLDRYRIPTLMVLPIVALLVGLVPLESTDHLYVSVAQDGAASPSADWVLKVGSRTPIVVAATGGGIQAAAWTAKVLTGIDDALGDGARDNFTHSIRLFSTVSGGGVGAMYFSERYKPEGFDHQSLKDVVDKAETSSLDDVAWGATYPDALATFFPPVRAAFGDRGQALEWAWTRSLAVARPLSEWRSQVWSDQRPANIFNATVVDTGERLLIGTSKLGWHEHAGLRNFEELYPNRDLQVVTAARLAASFTYVSPAARMKVAGPTYHVVDGGYYDDYGMTTAIEWVHEALQGTGGSFPHLMVIQIRSDSGDAKTEPDSWHGPFYQLWAPVGALLHVRSTGQISHNDEEFARLQDYWQTQGVEIDNVIFRFCGEHPPLSWHLTGSERGAIDKAWNDHLTKDRPEIAAIAAYLAGNPLPVTRPDRKFDVPETPCAPNAVPVMNRLAGGRR